MNLTEMDDKAARDRWGKLEVKVWWVILCLALIGVVVLLGRMFG